MNSPIDLLTACTQYRDHSERIAYEIKCERAFQARNLEYNHVPVQRATGLNGAILNKTPSGSTIVDVGAGTQSRFTKADLSKKNQRLVNVDYLYVDPSMKPQDDHVSITAELNTLTGKMSNQSLHDALQELQRGSPEELQKQIKLALERVQFDNLGAFIFSHCLDFVSDEIARRALTISANSLQSGGRIFLMGKTSKRYQTTEDVEGIFTSKFQIAQDLVASRDDLEVERDMMVVPIIDKGLYQRIIQKLEDAETSEEIDCCIREYDTRIETGEIQFHSCDPAEVDTDIDLLELPDNEIGDMYRADHVLIIQKR